MKEPQHTNEILEVLDFSERSFPVTEWASLKQNHKKNFFQSLSEVGIERVYFSGEFPSIYFKSVSDFQDEHLVEICGIHKKVWNERKAALLFVNSPVELRIYNCFVEPVNPDKIADFADAELFAYKLNDPQSKLEKLISTFSRIAIDSGSLWKEREFADKLNAGRRVDKALMSNLKVTRNELVKTGLSVDVIHDILLRSLFILYLEDRSATSNEFYDKYQRQATSYFDILDNVESTYALFAKLEDSFNGNLCPVTAREKRQVKFKHLKLIKDCFWSHQRASTSTQTVLFNWRAFDFSVIRIELISEIYEEFLSTERGENDTRKDGAYYTPHALVDFILNEKLPWASDLHKNYQFKIVDPTCGSGIFLVESFKRLVDRWKYANGKDEIDFETLKKILLSSVFGIEINSDAIKVAAFSLYLTMLDFLNPKTLWQNKRFPYLIYDPDVDDDLRRGKNLFRMSSLSSGPFDKINFDLVVGNPPFKRGNLDEDGKEYLSNLGFAQEYVQAFLHRVTSLCTNGQIALVSTSKILFNGTSGYSRFRDFLFNENYVEAIFNFSALRKTKKDSGGNLFASAVGPACVLFYQKNQPADAKRRILYCSPKAVLKNKLIDGISIDVSDVRYIPRKEASNPDSKIWKVAMWGTERDFMLIEKLGDTVTLGNELARLKKEKGWSFGNGFQTSQPQTKKDKEISSLKVLDTDLIDRYYVPKSAAKEKGPEKFRRIGDKGSYYGPHVVIKKGQKNRKFCSAFLDFDCSFRDGVYGIHAPKSDENLLKALTAYLNSSFAAYYLFMTISSLGVEREQVMLEEYLQLPALPLLLSEEKVGKVAALVDQIMSRKRKEIFVDDFAGVEKEIDAFFFAELGLSKREIALINDGICYGLDSFLEGADSGSHSHATASEVEKYCGSLSGTLNETLAFSPKSMVSSHQVLDVRRNAPLVVVEIKFASGDTRPSLGNRQPAIAVNDLIERIDAYCYEKHSESIFFRKIIKYYDNDSVCIIKPNEKRFWSKSSGVNDADEIISEILTS